MLVRLRHRALALAAAVLLAVPAAAFAQGGAGDEQYEDPFGDEPVQEQPSPQPTAAPAPAAPAPAATAAPSAGEPAQPPAAVPAGSPGAGNELPRTGTPVGLVALAGVALLAGGLLLRRRGDRGDRA